MEPHNLSHKTANHKIMVGDAVIVRTDNKNRGKWSQAVVEQIFPGRDGYTRAVQLRTTKGVIKRPVQHLCPLELQCETTGPAAQQLNPHAENFRPKRNAASVAVAKMKRTRREMNFRLGIVTSHGKTYTNGYPLNG